MAEEFGFHQRFGNGRAVDGDKRTVLARALVVDGLGDQIFAGAAFALNEDCGGLAGGHLLHEAHQLGYLRRDCDDLVISGVAAHLSTQGLDFGAQAGGLQRVLDGDP